MKKVVAIICTVIAIPILLIALAGAGSLQVNTGSASGSLIVIAILALVALVWWAALRIPTYGNNLLNRKYSTWVFVVIFAVIALLVWYFGVDYFGTKLFES